MNRNSEQHYAQVPHANIQRSQFNRPTTLLTSMNEGDLVPIYCDEVLPGDTAKINISAVIRMSTPLYPVMDNCYMDYYFFYVPNRTIWEHWENLCGQNDSTFWAETTEYSEPMTKAPTGGWEIGTIADYFGMPTGVEGIEVNSKWFRAYAKIWNEWFRDENLQQPVVQDMDDATNEGSNTGTKLTDAQNGGLPLKVARFHDYFSSALPQPQKGNAAELPISGYAHVYATSDSEKLGQNLSTMNNYLTKVNASNAQVSIRSSTANNWYSNGTAFNIIANGASNSGVNTVQMQNNNIPTPNDIGITPANLIADLGNSISVTINELRNAIAIQHILEQDARGGTRYNEILANEWGVTSPDARLQRSEYIGGGRISINVNQVVQTSSTDTTSPQGNTGAYSLTTLSKNGATYSAVEHGMIIGLAAIRVDHSYQQGLERKFTRTTRFTHYWPMLANLGEQPILNKEIYAQGTSEDDEVFGYQEAWADYRYGINHITGEMRSNYAQSLDSWHYGDYYTSLPKLSSSWIQEGTELIDRTLAVQSSNSHQFICNMRFDQVWTRPMPMYSIPGLNTI